MRGKYIKPRRLREICRYLIRRWATTSINHTRKRDLATDHLRQRRLVRATKNHIALENVQFECAAQWPFKGTYVRQDILHKTDWIEERNPLSGSALYVPLPHST
jgi:hypothetical protein